MSEWTRQYAMIALGLSALGLAAASPSKPARAADPSQQPCFYARDINGFQAPENRPGSSGLLPAAFFPPEGDVVVQMQK